jgi:hypothetical protein
MNSISCPVIQLASQTPLLRASARLAQQEQHHHQLRQQQHLLHKINQQEAV